MKNKKTLLSILTFLFIAAAVIAFAVNWYSSAYRKLARAQSFLARNDIDTASELFGRLEHSFPVRTEARLGRIITDVLRDRPVPPALLPPNEDVDILDFPIYRLLQFHFPLGNMDRCVRLAKLGRRYGLRSVDLYYAAAMLEKGNVRKAWYVFFKLPPRLRYSSMGNRLYEALQLLRSGASTIVRDRNGVLVGSVRVSDSGKEFSFYRREYRELIQPVVIHNVLAKSGDKRGLRLSIDLELSRLARQSLADQQGSIVLVDPQSGEILAAVSDRRTEKELGTASSPAFEQMLEPASISKLITITAAYRNQLDPDQEIAGKRCNGSRRYNGKILWCPSALRRLSGLSQALAVSCNSSFADLGVKVGWDHMLEELHLYGFDSEIGNPFSLGRIVEANGDDRSLADLSIGLENTVISPVHGALIANVFASGGYWLYPRLFHGEDGAVGVTPRAMEPVDKREKGRKILESSWLTPIRKAMTAVTRSRGTARYIAPAGFPVHMKTGTGGTYRDGFHINYIGYAPANRERDKIAFCVRVTGRRTSYRVRRAGYRVNHDLLMKLKEFLEERAAR